MTRFRTLLDGHASDPSLTSRSALLKKCRVARSRAWASLRTMLFISLSRWNILMAPLKNASLNAENTTSGGLLRQHFGQVVIHDFAVDLLETDEVLARERRPVSVVERLDDLGEGALRAVVLDACRDKTRDLKQAMMQKLLTARRGSQQG